MTLKKVLKKPEYKDIKELRIIDIPNHWEITIEINVCLVPKPLNRYFRKLLRRKVEDIYWQEDMLTLKVF